jgi:hypothetical protein
MNNDIEVKQEMEVLNHRPDPIKFEEFINRIKNEKNFPQTMSKCLKNNSG